MSKKAIDNYIGDGFVMALHRWLKPLYDMNSKKFSWDEIAASEAVEAHKAALIEAGQLSLA